MPEKLIGARYIGDHEVLLDIGQLRAAGRPLLDGYGQPLQPTVSNAVSGMPSYGLHYGDTLMMPETEVLGKTYLHDPHQQKDSILVGTGRVILAEHQGLSLPELQFLGYEFQEGRADFEPLIIDTPVVSTETLQTPSNNESPMSADVPVESPVDPVVNASDGVASVEV